MPFTPESSEPRNLNLQHVIAPDRNAGVSEPQPPREPQPEKRSKKGLVLGITGGLAGAAIAAGAIIGVNAAGEAPKSEPTASAPADPSETTEPTPEEEWSPEVAVEQLEIPAGLEVEQLGAKIIEHFDAWRNAGTDNEQIHSSWRDWTGKTGDYVQSIVQQYAPIYQEAMYVEDWRSHGDLVKQNEFNLGVNANTLEINLKTSTPANGDKVAFHRNIAYEGARELSNDGTTRIIEVDYVESNNAGQNRAGEDFAPETATFGTPRGTLTLTLVTVDGVEKIAASSSRSR